MVNYTQVNEDGCVLDEDKDDIPDDKDKCPSNTEEEVSKGVFITGPNLGCPMNSDNDDIPDYLDDCAKNTPLEISKGVTDKGCPIDTDKDEVFDYEDKCPHNSLEEFTEGVYQQGDMKGCPMGTDNDADGVPDDKDECPGTRSDVMVNEHGCAIVEIEEIMKYGDESFLYGKTVLTDKAKLALDIIIKKIDNNFLKNIEVITHTDSFGSLDSNNFISVERANNVAEYLIIYGIARDKISIVGKGEIQPLVSNDTEEGRHKNRRFELIIIKFKRKLP
ncbi:OmpA family protein [Thiotrichales bacterium HSG1]|nr:OmpA family protein [Thiotrichales bacterium HSG1]